MRIPISEIKINPGRREVLSKGVSELAKSIAEVGLLNPITLNRDNTLIAGLHRLEAAKLLGWAEVDCTVSSLEGLQAELAEIDENFVRTDLSKAGLYENFVKGMLDKAEYKLLRDGYTERMEELRSAIEQLRQEMERVTDRTSERQKWAQQFREFSNMTELDRRAVVTLIQSIRIISKNELKITFRYQMEYDAALQKLSQARLGQEAI